MVSKNDGDGFQPVRVILLKLLQELQRHDCAALAYFRNAELVKACLKRLSEEKRQKGPEPFRLRDLKGVARAVLEEYAERERELQRHWRVEIVQIARKQLRSKGLVGCVDEKDLEQACLLKLWQAWMNADQRPLVEEYGAFRRTVIRNAVIDELRKETRRRKPANPSKLHSEPVISTKDDASKDELLANIPAPTTPSLSALRDHFVMEDCVSLLNLANKKRFAETLETCIIFEGDLVAAAKSLGMKVASLAKNLKRINVFLKKTYPERFNSTYVLAFAALLAAADRATAESISTTVPASQFSMRVAVGILALMIQTSFPTSTDGDFRTGPTPNRSQFQVRTSFNAGNSLQDGSCRRPGKGGFETNAKKPRRHRAPRVDADNACDLRVQFSGCEGFLDLSRGPPDWNCPRDS